MLLYKYYSTGIQDHYQGRLGTNVDQKNMCFLYVRQKVSALKSILVHRLGGQLLVRSFCLHVVLYRIVLVLYCIVLRIIIGHFGRSYGNESEEMRVVSVCVRTQNCFHFRAVFPTDYITILIILHVTLLCTAVRVRTRAVSVD